MDDDATLDADCNDCDAAGNLLDTDFTLSAESANGEYDGDDDALAPLLAHDDDGGSAPPSSSDAPAATADAVLASETARE